MKPLELAGLIAVALVALLGWLAWSWARRAARRTRLRWRRRIATFAFIGQIVFFTLAYVGYTAPASHADRVEALVGNATGLEPGPFRTAATTCAATVLITAAAVLVGWPLDRRRT